MACALQKVGMTYALLPSPALRRALCALTLSVLAALPLPASTPDCEALAAQAAAQRGIPEGLLPSIARVESGRGQGKLGRRAWPWTLNQAGKGMYFDTRAEAMDYLRSAIARGVRNIDVGCMQINYRWHGDQFESLDAMMDPVANTRYGARFLAELHARHGSWETATGYYHSMTPERSSHYRGLVARVLKKMPAASTMLARLESTPPPPMSTPTDAVLAQTTRGLVAIASAPLVALHAVDVATSDTISLYERAMMDGSFLPGSAEPDLNVRVPKHAGRQATRRARSDSVQNQIDRLRADFDRQIQTDG